MIRGRARGGRLCRLNTRNLRARGGRTPERVACGRLSMYTQISHTQQQRKSFHYVVERHFYSK